MPAAQALIPSPANSQVWIDFDGTITQLDVLDELIRRFAIDDSWKQVEREWQEGLIGSAECLRRQLAVVRVSDEQLDQFLGTIPLDPGIFSLLELLRRMDVPVAILSDGIDLFIGRLLERAGLAATVFRCNSVVRRDRAMELVCPHSRADCESAAAHCKCASMTAMGSGRPSTIYIGDGRSDLCPSRKVDCRFAKGVLAMNLEREGLEYIPYETLEQVASMLATAWGTKISDLKSETESGDPPMSEPPIEPALVTAIDLLEPRMRTLLAESLRIPSVSGQEGKFTRFIADRLRSSGFVIDLWETDESQLAGYPVARAKHLPLVGRPTLVAKLKGTAGGKSLLFNAHSDVVAAPHPEQWSYGPWDGHEHQGKYFGRGACDVKGALVSAMWAMLAIKQAHPAGLPGDLILELVPGEEDCVTLGTLTSVVRGHTADACIVLEPTECLPRNASRPGLRFEITCLGKAVHGTVKWLGEDAIQLANAVVSALSQMENSLNSEPSDPYFYGCPIGRPITVDTIRGGEWQGMVCDRCLVAGYFELLPLDEPGGWKDRFTDELGKLLDLKGLDCRKVKVEFVEQYDGHRLDSVSELCRMAQQTVEFGIDLPQSVGLSWAGWAGFNSGCEAGLRAGLLRTPTLIWGPGSLAQAHAADEFVELSQVKLVADRFARFAVNWCR